MCTAITYQTGCFYFGRTLDYDCTFGEEVTVTPRGFGLRFRCGVELRRHHAMIGMAHVADGYPLYYDAVNEKGLCMAGLNFVGNARYREPEQGKDNIAVFEFIPWILGQCASVREARELLARMNLTQEAFSAELPTAQLHWIIADHLEAIVVESVAQGLRIHDNPVGVLTNNPPFDHQLTHLNHYLNLTPREPRNRFSDHLELEPDSRGMGAIGLPGDLSSQSRFVRAAFTKLNAVSDATEAESVSQVFHILGTVSQSRGCCRTKDGDCEITVYTACCNADKGIYYYTTYDNHQITAVSLHRENLEESELTRYLLTRGPRFFWQN